MGFKSCRFTTECVLFVHAWMYVVTQLELCLYDHTNNKPIFPIEWKASNFLAR